MKINSLHLYFLKSSGICTDTRSITKNCLFFALKGDNFNGNEFTQSALNKGAYKVIIDENEFETEGTILVENVLETLQQLATFHREYLAIPIIALTGSNGKTTTKELINAVLSKKYCTTATKGNLNNHIGVPLTLLSMNSETELGMVEMGANHLKEIELLSNITKPDYGYITNFGKAHLEGFGSLEGVVKAKTELYQYLKENNKTVFINATDNKQLQNSEGISSFTFGDNNQDCFIELVDASNQVIISYKNQKIKSNLIGLYNFNNIAAAICMGEYFNVSEENIKDAIEGYIPTNNRSQLINKGSNQIILDAYNANPSSMLAALENFNQSKGESKVLFLGDMFELGSEAENEHQNIVDFIETHNFHKTYLIGENFFKTKVHSDKIQRFKTFKELQKELETNTLTQSQILIKASRSMALEQILDII
ncbi:MAG: UDP-N-acetylmuramoyl-tripeptide--D-alanyl-D-alanine ligase [Flavobacteriaceae bacterium]|nr:UDP-N-acetylmuramoyl-tripeptide--D-alanyl-D-alanine ligase [Flavobacteriaceae bacterium]